MMVISTRHCCYVLLKVHLKDAVMETPVSSFPSIKGMRHVSLLYHIIIVKLQGATYALTSLLFTLVSIL